MFESPLSDLDARWGGACRHDGGAAMVRLWEEDGSQVLMGFLFCGPAAGLFLINIT